MTSAGSAAHSKVFRSGALRGRVVLVTGGGTGLGRASALELVRCGAHVFISGRRREVLEGAALQITDDARARGRVGAVAGDIRDPADAERMVATVMEEHGRLDVLVNNAGGQYFVPAEAIAAKGWQAVWRLNFEGTVNMTDAAVEGAMRAHGGGTIINVTFSPHHGLPGMTHSGSARAAVEAWTRAQAREWMGLGITLVAVAAGHFETEAIAKYPEAVRAGAARSVPVGRLGRPEEHAWLVALLCSSLGRALNGSVVTLDGARDNWFGPWPPADLLGDGGDVPTEERRGASG